MPGRNIYKQYAPDTYYHVYNRGVDKQAIFRDDDDYAAFLHLLKRYLDPTDRSERTANSRSYPCYDQDITLHAYCLMPNHFHMLMYQITDNGMRQLMKSVTVAYSMYFNKKCSTDRSSCHTLGSSSKLMLTSWSRFLSETIFTRHFLRPSFARRFHLTLRSERRRV